jgi:chromosome segregation ATPase
MADEHLEAEIERVKAQIELMAQARESFAERLGEFAERLGELRMALTEHEKRADEILTQALQAVDMVRELKPDELIAFFKRAEARVDALRARIESGEARVEEMGERLAELGQAVSRIRGLEELLKLSREIRRELGEAKRVEGKMAKHADKVETIFVEVQAAFGRFAQLEARLDELVDALTGLTGDVTKLKTALRASIRRGELEKFKKAVDARLATISQLSEKLAQRERELERIILSSKRLSLISERVRRELRQTERALHRLDVLERRVKRAETKSRLVKPLEARLVRLSERLKTFAPRHEMDRVRVRVDKELLALAEERDALERLLKDRLKQIGQLTRRLEREQRAVRRTIDRAQVGKLARRVAQLEKRQTRILALLEELS